MCPVDGSRLHWPFVALLIGSAALFEGCGRDSQTPTGSTPPGSAPVSPQVATVALSPDSLLLALGGDTARVSAVVRDQNGREISTPAIHWTSSDTTVAAVDPAGLVTSRRAGLATISASAGSISAASRAIVMLQPNARCRIPVGVPEARAVAVAPTFSAAESLRVSPLTFSRHKVVVYDYDGDGDDDAAVFDHEMPPNTPYGGLLHLWRNDGQGHFSDAATEALGGATVRVDNTSNQVVVADLDGNGILDLFAPQGGFDAAPYPGAPNLLLLGAAGGRLVDASAARLQPNEAAFTHSAAGADIDCDGDVDLYEGNILKSPHLLLNVDGVFRPADDRLPRDIGPGSREYLSAEFCDVDRDGDPDLLLGGWQNHRGDDRLLINNGFGRFRDAAPGALPSPFFSSDNITISVRCTDFDRDGWNDLIVSATNEYRSPHLAFWRNRGDGTFEDRTNVLFAQAWQGSGWYFRLLHIADLNGDGWPDIVAPGGWQQGPQLGSVLLNGGAAGFRDIASTIPDLSRAQFESYCDFSVQPIMADGDGRVDLLVVRSWYQCQSNRRPAATLLRNRGP